MAYEVGVAGPVLDRASAGRQGRGRAIAAGRPRPGRGVAVATRARSHAFPELDCLEGRLPRAVIAAVERRAVETGVGAERVLIAAGIVQEDSYLKLLARSLRLPFEPLDRHDRRSCPLDDRQLVEAARTGLLPFLIDGELVFVVAPRSVRQFVQYVTSHPHVHFHLTSMARLDRFIAEAGRDALGHKAAFAFDAAWPRLSAASRSIRLRIGLAATIAAIGAALIGLPSVVVEVFTASLAAFFLAWLGLRNLGSFVEPLAPPPAAMT